MTSSIVGYADFTRRVASSDEEIKHYTEGEPFTDGRKVGWVKTHALLPYREYDRRSVSDAHPGGESARTIESIKQDIGPGGKGWQNPVSLSYDHASHRALLDEGNHRLQAALEAGVEHVPVTVNRAYKGGLDDHRLALWGRSQVRTQPDDFGSVPGQMHPHEVMPDHLLHPESRRPDDFANWGPRHKASLSTAATDLPEGWTSEPGKDGSAIKTVYKHADTGTSVYFPKTEQHHKNVELSDDDERAFIPHVHTAVQKTGEHGVAFMVDTGHDRYFRTAKKETVGGTGAYVSTDDPDTVRVNPHWVNARKASLVQNHLRNNLPTHFTPASHGVDVREYAMAHELGHVHDFRNQHTLAEKFPGSGVLSVSRPAESSFYGRAGGKRMSQYADTNTREAYAEGFAHHHLAGSWRGVAEHVDQISDKYADRYGWQDNHHDGKD